MLSKNFESFANDFFRKVTDITGYLSCILGVQNPKAVGFSTWMTLEFSLTLEIRISVGFETILT